MKILKINKSDRNKTDINIYIYKSNKKKKDFYYNNSKYCIFLYFNYIHFIYFFYPLFFYSHPINLLHV